MLVMMELRDQGQPRDTGTRYPEDVKELAYQLWAFMSGRNASEVARHLATVDYGGVEVPRETVAYWAREYKWAERAASQVQQIAPDLRHQAFSELLFAGLEGAKYLRRVVSGLEDEPDVGDMPATDDPAVKFDRIMAKVRSHDSARKAKIQAAIAAVDRIGFSPVGKGMPGVEAPTTNSDVPAVEALTGKSPDELMRMEQQWRERKGR